MRDTTDQATAELAGMPSYEYLKEGRDNQSRRAKALGYQGPKRRPRCETCEFVSIQILNPDAMHERELRRCRKGNFQVMRGGICDHYKPA